MDKRRFVFVLSLLMAMAFLPWGVNQGHAESDAPPPAEGVTLPYRNPDNVPKLRSTTNAQREEAARRAAEYRAEAARAAAFGNITTPEPAAPPHGKGGKK